MPSELRFWVLSLSLLWGAEGEQEESQGEDQEGDQGEDLPPLFLSPGEVPYPLR